MDGSAGAGPGHRWRQRRRRRRRGAAAAPGRRLWRLQGLVSARRRRSGAARPASSRPLHLLHLRLRPSLSLSLLRPPGWFYASLVALWQPTHGRTRRRKAACTWLARRARAHLSQSLRRRDTRGVPPALLRRGLIPFALCLQASSLLDLEGADCRDSILLFLCCCFAGVLAAGPGGRRRRRRRGGLGGAAAGPSGGVGAVRGRPTRRPASWCARALS